MKPIADGLRLRNLTGARATRLLAAACVALAAMGDAVAQPKPAAPATAQPAQIDRNGVLILIRSALLALHHGNETGNYTVLRDLSAPSFREANTAARLGEIFASQRAQRLDLSGVAVLDPQLTLLPQIEANGLLHMTGFFPSVSSQVNFELLFAPVEGHWRLFGVSLNVGSSAPTAPAAVKPEPSPPPRAVGKSELPRNPKRSEQPKSPSKTDTIIERPAASEPRVP